MSRSTPSRLIRRKADRVVTIILFFLGLAMIGRTLAGLQKLDHANQIVWLLGLELVFLGLYTLISWLPRVRRTMLYVYLTIQTVILLAVIAQAPRLDFLIDLFILLVAQAAIYLTSRDRWGWILGLVALSMGSSILWQGPVNGLALGLVPVAVEVVIAVSLIAGQEVEAAQFASQAMVRELEDRQEQLKVSAGQAEELASIEERNRLARELHDSVSQTLFSIQLNARSAALLLQKDPARVRPQLDVLQDLAQSALAEMRAQITQMRTNDE